MVQYLTHIKDSIGNNYLGVSIPKDIIKPFLDELKDILGDSFDTFTKNQQNRDHGSYHITVINVMDYNALSVKMGIDNFVNSLNGVLSHPIDDIKMLGIGMSQKSENKAYYVVCKSDKLDSIRDFYSLPSADFHITLGFNFKDVHGVRKNELFTKDTEFFKTIKSEFLRSENFEFIRNISNFESNSESEIVPIYIDMNKLKVKCDDYVYIICINDENKKLFVTNKYKTDKNETRIPQTEIIKKFI